MRQVQHLMQCRRSGKWLRLSPGGEAPGGGVKDWSHPAWSNGVSTGARDILGTRSVPWCSVSMCPATDPTCL